MKFSTVAAIGLSISVPLAKAYSGDMTHYTPGMGSCGITSTDGEDVVALSKDFMTYAGNPNSNPKCGSKISIWNPVTQMTFEATVVDTCEGCQKFDIDVSPSLFEKVAPSGDGRVKGIDWGGKEVGG